MQYTAYWALLASLLVALLLCAFALYEAWRRDASRLSWIENGHTGLTAFVTGASVILAVALWTRDFSFKYVAEYTDSFLPLFYAVTAFWAGQAGSLLFWMLLLALCGLAFARTRAYQALSPETRLYFWIFYLGVEAFFLLLLTGPSTPFISLSPPPPDGRGLNPLLRNPGMIFHPPLLFMGYAGFTVPCCLALACWITGERISWIAAARNFTLLSWIFLTAGIILGGWWSYMELGWGGYWAWDPVENASLIPWLVGTAFVHTAIVESRRGSLQKTNILLVSLTLISAFFATYLVRSGVVESLHAFGEGGVSRPIFLLLIFCLAITFLVLHFGAEGREPGRPLSGLASLPGFLVMLAWLLLALALVVALGTMWPVISQIWSANSQGLDAGFYNKVCNPLFVLIAVFVIFCPWLSWKEGFRKPKIAAFLAAVFLGLAAVLYIMGVRRPEALVGAAGSLAALVSVGILFATEKSARSAKGSLAAYLVHGGLALVILGVAISGPYQTVKEAFLNPGHDLVFGDYRLVYEDLVMEEGKAMASAKAVIKVEKDGEPFGVLTPERRIYRNYDQPFAEVSTIPTLGDELYATLLSSTEQKSISIKVSVNPLVNWIWIGGTIMCLAGLVGLRRFRPGARAATPEA